MRVITCLTTEHNLLIVGLSALFCLLGSGVTISLFNRMLAAPGSLRTLRLILAGISAGATTWCTHFVAMLGYNPGVVISYEPAQTALSLAAAILGSAMALWIASRERSALNVVLGGATLGLTMAIMHYLGMSAYVVDGILMWRYPYVLLSVVLAVSLSITALFVARFLGRGLASSLGTSLLFLSIMGLHFVGMAALRVTPTGGAQLTASSGELVLAVTVIGVGIIVMAIALAAHFIDLQSNKEAMERMRHLAMCDLLTELPNRAHFSEHLRQSISASDGIADKLAVLVIDLDRFKDINDLRGHAAGDKVLRMVSQRMGSVLRQGEFLARLGGDEFAAVKMVLGRDEAGEFAERLHGAISQSMKLDDGLDSVVEGSIGISLYPDDGSAPEILLGNADLAMYRAKAHPSEPTCFYSREMDESVRARRQVVSDLRIALGEAQFEIHYQVQTSLATNETIGYEALLRWRHPEKGIVSAEEFIPTAEETGLILPIGEWVLRQACQDAMGWTKPCKVAVNLSAVQFAHSDLPGLVERVLAETGLPPGRLELELTETTLMSDPDHNIEILRKIQGMGVSLALDDFGTGYSSLSTLRRFRFNRIKLDKSFVAEIEKDMQAKAIIRAVIAMGDGLGIPVLAEGIETEGQLAFLIFEGCNEAQGYLIGRPGKREGERHPDRVIGETAIAVA